MGASMLVSTKSVQQGRPPRRVPYDASKLGSRKCCPEWDFQIGAQRSLQRCYRQWYSAIGGQSFTPSVGPQSRFPKCGQTRGFHKGVLGKGPPRAVIKTCARMGPIWGPTIFPEGPARRSPKSEPQRVVTQGFPQGVPNGCTAKVFPLRWLLQGGPTKEGVPIFAQGWSPKVPPRNFLWGCTKGGPEARSPMDSANGRPQLFSPMGGTAIWFLQVCSPKGVPLGWTPMVILKGVSPRAPHGGSRRESSMYGPSRGFPQEGPGRGIPKMFPQGGSLMAAPQV
jgi:hypothetical protein